MSSPPAAAVTLFLAGDVMTGRGIDQILPHPNPPVLHESYVRDAREYVRLAERVSGPISAPVAPRYVWGDALGELDRVAPDLRLVNLETSVTVSDDFQTGKGIHYRMQPRNVACLTAAHLDGCTLANNHVLDLGRAGLTETLATLAAAGIATCGAGESLAAAQQPLTFDLSGSRRVVVVAAGSTSAGIPPDWAATPDRSGLFLFDEHDSRFVDVVCDLVAPLAGPGTLVVASLHWGGNWGYDVPASQRRLAQRLIDDAGVHIVWGHSCHHVKGFEVYRNRLILYGCGDLLTDYEGISSHDEFRNELGLLYFPTLDPDSGHLRQLELVPTRMRRLQITRADPLDTNWLADTLNREGAPFGTRVDTTADGRLFARWS